MKVLITSPSLDEKDNVSGIASVIRGVIERSGSQFVLFAAGRKDGERLNATWLLRQFALPFGILRRIRNEKPDIVHINTSMVPMAVFRDLALAAVARSAGCPILLHIHGGPFVTRGLGNFATAAAAKMLLRISDLIVVLSEVEKESLLKYLPNVQIRVLPNAIPIDAIPEFERLQNGRTIIFLGRLHESKGLREIVQICKRLLEQGADFRFTCYGTGPEQEKFTSDMTAVLGDKFHFGGVVTGAEKWRALRNADIFLLPSRYEGLPIALLEAMAAGCVPVISATGSVSTVVDDGVNGFLIEPDAISDIAEKVSHLLTDHGDLKRMSENARATVRTRFSLKDYVEKLDAIYAALLNKH
ncbi:MAG: glycosyltransferase family 4 protein [Pyrinomonadaceae bacterium]